MVKCPAAAFFRKAQIFNLQHLRLPGKINASFKSMVLCILSYHILYDPAKLNIFNCCICNVFSIPEYGNMIADFHNFFQTMRNIYNRNPSLQKLSHDFEKNFNLCSRKRGCRFIHDQYPQIVLIQITCNLYHLLLAYTKISNHCIRRNLMLQTFQDLFGTL